MLGKKVSSNDLIGPRNMKTLCVVEEDKLWVYTPARVSNGLYVYNPPAIKNERDACDEFLFLPVTTKEFRDHDETYFGYKFTMSSHSATKVSVLGMASNEGIGMTQMTYSVSRFLYYTKGKHTVVITNHRDPLFPAETVELKCDMADIGHAIQEFVDKILRYYTSYYYKHLI